MCVRDAADRDCTYYRELPGNGDIPGTIRLQARLPSTCCLPKLLYFVFFDVCLTLEAPVLSKHVLTRLLHTYAEQRVFNMYDSVRKTLMAMPSGPAWLLCDGELGHCPW